MKATIFLTILPTLIRVVSSHPLSGDESSNITLASDSDIETRELHARGTWNVGKHLFDGVYIRATGLGLSAIARTPQSIQLFFIRGAVGAARGSLTEIHWEEGKNWQKNDMRGNLPGTTSIEGYLTALSRRSDREEVFYGWDDEIKSHHWTGSWQYSQEAHSLKYDGGKIAALANSANEMELFYVGDDDAIRNSYWVENKTPWTHNRLVEAWEAKGPHNREIVAVRSNNQKYVFWMTKSGEIRSYRWQPNSGWGSSGPLILGANAWGGLAVVSRKAGEIELFWIGRNKKIYHAYNTGGWKVLQLSDSEVASTIQAVSRHENHMEIFWIRPDGAIYHKFWINGIWSEGQVPGAGPGTCNPQSEIALVSRKSNTVEGWCRSPTNSELLHFYYYD